MRFDRFTEKAQEAVQEAAELAAGLGQQAVEPEHLILALIRQPEGVGRTLLEHAGVSVLALEPALNSTIERFPKVSGGGQPQDRCGQPAGGNSGKSELLHVGAFFCWVVRAG